MCKGWEFTTIGDVCEAIYDGPHATPKKTLDGPIFLGISNLQNGRLVLTNTDHLSEEDYIHWTRRVTPEAGDVVFSYETRLGEAAIIPQGLRCCLGRRMALIRPDRESVVPRFLLYAFLSPAFQEEIRARTVHGSTVDRILLTEFPRFPISLPPLEEQGAIAHFLGTLDDKIELNRQMNQTLDEIARTLFTSWFVSFDPVRAKVEGRQPEGMDAETAALFPDRFVDSELGPIPEGWEVSAIGDVATVVGGSTPSTKSLMYWDGGTHLWATPKDLSSLASPILIDTSRKITDAGVLQISSRQLPVGTVLLSSRAPVGYLAMTTEPTSINQGFIAMICDRDVSSYFVLNWARGSMETIKGNAGGTTFAEISKTAFRPIKVIVPTNDVLCSFSNAVAPQYGLIEENLREMRTLAELRDTLLPELLSGRVRVGEAESPGSEAV